MKTSFRQFVSDLNRKHSFQRRLISILCVLSLLVSFSVSMLLTLPGMTASLDPELSGGVVELLTDEDTHNAWIDYFKIGVSGNNFLYNTEFVGSVWTDKSVFTQYTTSKGLEISADSGNMLGVLSAIGSSMAITGRIYTPTDVMLILDMSSSMYKNGSTNHASTVQNMVNAVNDSIDTLLSLNQYNRVGVVVYFGGPDVIYQSDTQYGYIMLPLDRYTAGTDGTYVTAKTSGTTLNGVWVSSGVKNSAGSTVSKGHNVNNIAGTYAQLGINLAMDQFTAAGDLEVEMAQGVFVKRQPIFVFMSDGKPTAAAVNYVDPGKADFGNNQEASRSDDEADFVTQLTAAYAKEQVSNHYNIQPLFYTLGLGSNLALSIMDPANNTSSKINKYWSELVTNGKTSFTVAKVYNEGKWTYGPKTFTVNRLDNFPTDVTQRYYVDNYYNAATADKLADAFENIVNEIILKSIYTPTHVGSNKVNTSGDVSFVDKIGQYMEVTQIRGVLLGGNLHTGAAFAKVLSEGEKTLGTLGNATEFGLEFWNNVMEQIGIREAIPEPGPNGEEFGPSVPAVIETDSLIRSAWGAGQLSYTSDTEFSNYIGWYADANNQYLGFWNDKDPSQTPVPEGATQKIKTYFFQSDVDGEDHHTMTTNMMYVTVWVKEDITTGNQTVVFSVPASLLPTLKYFVDLDEKGNFVNIHLGSIDQDTVFEDGRIKVRPIRLVYEVGLREDIDTQNLLDKVDVTYLQNNRDPVTGKVYFYANEWERGLDANGLHTDTGYNMSNTYAYFRPSKFNDRYYYVEDSYIYYKDPTTGEYYPCTTDDPAYSTLEHSEELYTIHPLYIRVDADTIDEDVYYMPLGDYAMDHAKLDGKQWYVPAGTDHSLNVNESNRFARAKENNITGTLHYRNIPHIDRTNVTSGTYLLAATLGNNGRIAVIPEGQSLIKRLVDENGEPLNAQLDQSFQFLIHEGPALTTTDAETGATVPVDYNDPSAVLAQLQGKKVSVLTLDVPAGKAESAIMPLTNMYTYTVVNGQWYENKEETWSCTYTHEYTIVELAPDERYELVDIGGVSGSYTFVYGEYPTGQTNYTIVAANRFVPWKIQLTKVDSQQTANQLPGAVFGLYSPYAEDALDVVPEEYAHFDKTYTYDSRQWYLAKIDVTGENGDIAWDGLSREEYLLLELQAPPGYYPPENKNAQVLQRSASAKPCVYEVTISNTPGFEMPSTGGSGNFLYIIIGTAIMVCSGMAMIVYHFRRKEERVSN